MFYDTPRKCIDIFIIDLKDAKLEFQIDAERVEPEVVEAETTESEPVVEAVRVEPEPEPVTEEPVKTEPAKEEPEVVADRVSTPEPEKEPEKEPESTVTKEESEDDELIIEVFGLKMPTIIFTLS